MGGEVVGLRVHVRVTHVVVSGEDQAVVVREVAVVRPPLVPKPCSLSDFREQEIEALTPDGGDVHAALMVADVDAPQRFCRWYWHGFSCYERIVGMPGMHMIEVFG